MPDTYIEVWLIVSGLYFSVAKRAGWSASRCGGQVCRQYFEGKLQIRNLFDLYIRFRICLRFEVRSDRNTVQFRIFAETKIDRNRVHAEQFCANQSNICIESKFFI